MTSIDVFTPRWASSPGATLCDVLDERRLSTESFAELIGVELSTAHGLLNGETPITVGLARKLAEHIGSTAEFWLARDAQYREDTSRVEADRWAGSFPIGQMALFGWITKPADWKERIDSCLSFFNVKDYREWRALSQPALQTAYFRLSPASAKEPAILAWLRQGEIVTGDQPRNSWDPATFRRSLQQARSLTREMDPAKFVPALTSLCADAGVRFAVVRAPQGCPVSGVARFAGIGSPTIVLSARYLADDHFWFSFFHEAGHLLLHGSDELYIDDDRELRGGPNASSSEREANQFAERIIIPQGVKEAGLRRYRAREIVEAARGLGIGPGVLLGQLQHAGVIGFHALNGLKRHYRWAGVSLEKA